MNYLSLTKRKKAHKETISFYGKDAQIIKAIEELSELQKELCKYLNDERFGKTESMIGEVADVRNMLEQIEIIFNFEKKVIHEQSNKVNRVINRIIKAMED